MTAQEVDIIDDIIRPTPKQWQCIQTTDSHRFTLYGGAAGGGKSYILRWWLVRQLLKRFADTGIVGLTTGLFSMDYPTLRDRQASRIKQEFPAWLGDLRESRDEGWNFFIKPEFGAGRIALRNLSDPSAYKSAEFCDIAIEELSENLRQVFEELVLFRLRYPGIDRPCFLGATNPTGRGLQWIKALWIDRKFPKELEDLKDEFAYVPALVHDNPHLTADYAAGLRGLPDAKRRALLEGDWSIPEGQYFTNWEREDRRVSPDILRRIIKPWWPRWISQDWGFKHHSPVHWHTHGDVMPEDAKLLGRNWTEPRKCVFTYREYVVSLADEQMSEVQWANEVISRNAGDGIRRYFLSADAFGQKSSAHTPSDLIGATMKQAGLPRPERANMAPGSRPVGWRFMYNLIQSDSWFISDMCPIALDAVPAAEYDSEKGGEDILKTDSIYDDVLDELRYGLSDMLNTNAKPFAVEMQERVQQVFRESGPTAANLTHMKMMHEQKKAKRWRPNYS